MIRSLGNAEGAVFPTGPLEQLVSELPGLQRLSLHISAGSAADVAQLAVTAQGQAEAGQRTQPLVVGLDTAFIGLSENGPVGAAAVNHLLSREGRQLTHAIVQEWDGQ